LLQNLRSKSASSPSEEAADWGQADVMHKQLCVALALQRARSTAARERLHGAQRRIAQVANRDPPITDASFALPESWHLARSARAEGPEALP